MKNLLAALFLICGLAARAQTFTPIHNYQQPDGLSVFKYFGIPYGPTPQLNVTRLVPGAIFYNTTDTTMYSWTGTQWIKAGTGGGVVISPGDGIDSVTLHNNTICQWKAGVSTCYNMNLFFTDWGVSADRLRLISYNFMGDSLKTVTLPHTIAEQGAGMLLTRRGDTVNFATSGTDGTVPKFTPTAVPYATADSTLGEDQPGLNYNGTNLAVGHNNFAAQSGITINGSRGLVLADIGGLYISAGGNATIGVPDATKHIKLQNNSNTLVDIYADGNTLAGLHTNIKTDVLIDSLKTTGTAPLSAGTDRMVTTDINGKLSFAAIPTPGGSVSLTAGLGLSASPSTITGSGSFALDSASAVVLSRARAAATYQPLLTGTGFVKSTAGTITYDNSTYQTANQAVTVTATGDATGTSSASGTAPSIPLVLATVNSNVGSFTNANVTVNAKGLVTAVSNGSGGGATPDSSWITGEFGTSYPIMGTLYDTSFQGTILPSLFASSAPNATITVNNGVTVSGGRGWYNVLKTKNYNYDKMNVQFTIIPSTKNAADSGIGIIFGRHTPSLYPNNDNHLVVKFNLSNNATDSGVISIGYDTATFIKRSSPLAFNATDPIDCSLRREGWALIASMYNTINHQKVEAIIFNANGFGTGGPLQLAFRSAGAIKLVNYKVKSWNRKNSGFAAFGASQINAGSRREATSWPSLVFRGNKARYSTFGNPSITLDSMIVAPQPEVIAMAPQYVIMEGPYNDYHYFGSDTTTTKVKQDTLIARFIRAGITPILMNLAPATSATNGGITEASFNTMIHNQAIKYGLREIDINTPLKNGGSTIWLNYLGPDNVHLSDSGQIVTANAVISKISDLLGLYTGDTTSFLKAYNVPSGVTNMARLVVGSDNNIYQVPSDALDSATLLFNHYNSDATGSAISQKNSSAYLDGPVSTDSVLFLRARSAAKINFANSTTMVVTNKPDNAGNGTPIAEFMRQTHSFIFDNGEANFTTHSLETGADLVMMGDGVGNTSQSGGNKTYSRAVLLGKEIGSSMTTASGVIGIGSKALLGVTTGSNILQLNTSSSEGLLLGGNSNAMFIGDATYGNDAIPTGTIALAPNSGISNNTLMLGVQKSYVAGMAPVNTFTTQNSSGTNIAGGRLNILAPSSTGYAEAGKTYLSFTNVGTTGTATNSTQSITMQAERLGVTIGKGTTLTKAPDAIADFQANTTDNMGGVTYPSYTSAQRSNISTGILTIAIAGAGTGQTAGQTPLIFSGGTGTAATGYATVSAGIVISTVITYRGAYSVAPTTVTVAAGGTPATFTITLGATASNTIYCSDCTATDGSTGVIETWNGAAWKNHW